MDDGPEPRAAEPADRRPADVLFTTRSTSHRYNVWHAPRPFCTAATAALALVSRCAPRRTPPRGRRGPGSHRSAVRNLRSRIRRRARQLRPTGRRADVTLRFRAGSVTIDNGSTTTTTASKGS
jgi:hypothetical protein